MTRIFLQGKFSDPRLGVPFYLVSRVLMRIAVLSARGGIVLIRGIMKKCIGIRYFHLQLIVVNK